MAIQEIKKRKRDNNPSLDCPDDPDVSSGIMWKIDEKAKPYRFAFFIALFILAWTVYDQARKGTFSVEPSESCIPLRIDVNRADAVELSLLPGIGPALAQRIILHRESSGPFERLSDLEKVKGLGPAKVFKIAKWILVDEQERIPTVNMEGARDSKEFVFDR